jgi:hypothetical protein
MGKYTEALKGRPVYRDPDETRNAKVDALKAELKAQYPSPASVAKATAEQRLKIDAIEEVLKAEGLRLDALTALLVERYEDEDTSSIKLSDGGSVRVQIEPYASVEDRAKVRRWCIDNGMEELFTIPWATLNSVTKERLLDGEPEPDGVKIFLKNKVVVTKPKKE